MNENQIKGRLKKAKGKAREIAGKATGNDKLENEGRIEKLGGKVEAGYGDLKQDIKRSTK